MLFLPPSRFRFPSAQTKDKSLGWLYPFDALQAVFPMCVRAGGHSLSHRCSPVLIIRSIDDKVDCPAAVVPKGLSLAGVCLTDICCGLSALRSQPSLSPS